MNNELSHSQIIAIEEFAKDLQENFANYRKNHPDNLSDIVLEYVNKVIDIHIELAKIKFERFALNQEEVLNGK